MPCSGPVQYPKQVLQVVEVVVGAMDLAIVGQDGMREVSEGALGASVFREGLLQAP